MPGDPFKKYQIGEKLRGLPAPLLNALIDEVRGADTSSGTSGSPYFRQTGIVKILNNSGADRGQFSILGLNGPIITPTVNLNEFKRQVTFKGIKPTVDHVGRIAVLLEPIRSGKIGRAVVSGVVPVRLTGAVTGGWGWPLGLFAELIHNDSDKLQVADQSGSAVVLWMETNTGERWALVRLTQSTNFAGMAIEGAGNNITLPIATAQGIDFSSGVILYNRGAALLPLNGGGFYVVRSGFYQVQLHVEVFGSVSGQKGTLDLWIQRPLALHGDSRYMDLTHTLRLTTSCTGLMSSGDQVYFFVEQQTGAPCTLRNSSSKFTVSKLG